LRPAKTGLLRAALLRGPEIAVHQEIELVAREFTPVDGITHRRLEPFDRGARPRPDLPVHGPGVIAEVVQRRLRLAPLLRGRDTGPHDPRTGRGALLTLVLARGIADDPADDRTADELARVGLGPLGR
jgi:hypothetical protein